MMNKSILFVAGMMMIGSISLVQAEAMESVPPPGTQSPGSPGTSGYPFHGRIRIEKGRNEEGYQLRIYTGGNIDPESVQVTIQGRSILIENDQSFQREERNERGAFNYARSSSHIRRRFSIPRQADVDKMQRRVEDGVLIITLPYRKDHRW
jgi:HSP20 family molecular chaperone IbpA